MLQLRHGTWDEARAMCGSPLAELEGADAVEAGALRRILEAHEWDYPPGTDLAAARELGQDALVAPATGYSTFAMPAYWSPGDGPLNPGAIPPYPFAAVPGVGSMIIATSVAVRFGSPVCVGDELHSSWTLVSVTEKELRIGAGAFLVFRADVRNQHGVIVAEEETTTFRYEPSPVRQDVPSPASVDLLDGEIGPCSIELSLQRLVMAAGANRDLAPVHHDPTVAERAGLGAPFANSMFLLTHMERTVVEWAGWRTRLAEIRVDLLRPSPAGTSLVATGSVDDTQRSSGRGRVSCDLCCRTGVDEVTATGFAAFV